MASTPCTNTMDVYSVAGLLSMSNTLIVSLPLSVVDFSSASSFVLTSDFPYGDIQL
jgi:3-polyprenyl-4-hydroxybenzoate decarboxylase